MIKLLKQTCDFYSILLLFLKVSLDLALRENFILGLETEKRG
jgi:hypothetical protein